MGNLFGSAPEQQPRRENYYVDGNWERNYYTERPQTSYYTDRTRNHLTESELHRELAKLEQKFQEIHISTPQRQTNNYGYGGSTSSATSTNRNHDLFVPETKVRTRQPQYSIVNIDTSIISNNGHLEDYQSNLSLGREVVSYVRLPGHSFEFQQMERLFRKTNKRFFKVSEIYRIENPYLYAAYLLKKEQLKEKYVFVIEELLFHGTKEINVDSICKFNLNWRLRGTSRGHKFGQGVSFSPISYYATHYSDKKAQQKVMLVVKVLVARACLGNKNMELPTNGCDTSQNDKGHVIVKYDDSTFYPAYKITYSNSTSKPTRTALQNAVYQFSNGGIYDADSYFDYDSD